MANVKLGNDTYEGVLAVKMDSTDGGEVVFTLEGSGGADTGILFCPYDVRKEYETTNFNGVTYYKISDATLDTTEFHRAMVIIPNESGGYVGDELFFVSDAYQGFAGLMVATWNLAIELVSQGSDEVRELLGIPNGIWVTFHPEVEYNLPCDLPCDCYFVFHKK